MDASNVNICSVCGGKCEAGLTDVCWGCRVFGMVTRAIQVQEDYGRAPGSDRVVARRTIRLGVEHLDRQGKKIEDFFRKTLTQCEIKSWNERERRMGLENEA